MRILRGLDGKEDPSARRSIRDAKGATRDARSPRCSGQAGFASLAGCSVRILKKLKGSGWQIETDAKLGTRD